MLTRPDQLEDQFGYRRRRRPKFIDWTERIGYRGVLGTLAIMLAIICVGLFVLSTTYKRRNDGREK